MIKDDIQEAIFVSLKARKQVDLKALRYILSQVKYAQIEKKGQLTDDEVVKVLQKEVKKRKEAIILFKKGKRDDLVKDEESQLDVIGKFLPKQLSEEELSKIIDETLGKIPDTSNIGLVIGKVMNKVKGKADGGKVARLVNEKLSS